MVSFLLSLIVPFPKILTEPSFPNEIDPSLLQAYQFVFIAYHVCWTSIINIPFSFLTLGL